MTSRKHTILATIILVSILISLLSSLTEAIVFTPGASCVSNIVGSPRETATLTGTNIVVEEPMMLPIGGFLEQGQIRISQINGKSMWIQTLPHTTYTNYISLSINYTGGHVALSKYFNGSYIVDTTLSQVNVSQGTIYWIGTPTTTIITSGNQTKIISVYSFLYSIYSQDFNITNIQPQKIYFLDIAPSYMVTIMNEDSSLTSYYVGQAFIGIPSYTFNELLDMINNNASISKLSYTVFPLEPIIIYSGSSELRFIIIYDIRIDVNYIQNGNNAIKTYETFAFLHGLLNTTNLNLNVSLYMLDLTTDQSNNYLITRAKIYGIGGAMHNQRIIPIDIQFTVVNATNTSDVIFNAATINDLYYVTLIGNWITLVPYPRDIIVNTIISGQQQYYSELVIAYGRNDLFVAVQPQLGQPLIQNIDENYITNILNSVNYSLVSGFEVSFLPLAWVEQQGNNIIINKNGSIIIISGVVRDTNNNIYMMVIPYYNGGQIPPQAPDIYNYIYNNGIPYLINLTGTSYVAQTDNIGILGWHILGFVNDTQQLFGLSQTGFVPLIVTSLKYDWRKIDSVEFVDFLQSRSKIQFDIINVSNVFIEDNLTNMGGQIDKILRDYLLGPGLVATELDNLNILRSWVVDLVPEIPGQSIVSVNATLDIVYMDDVLEDDNYYNTLPFIVIQNSYIRNPTPFKDFFFTSPNVTPIYFDIGMNNISGTPVMQVGVYPSAASPYDIPVVVVTDVIEGDDPGHIIWYNGASPTIINYAVVSQLDKYIGTTDISELYISPGLFYIGRQGYSISGIYAVGSFDQLIINMTIGSYARYTTTGLVCDVVNYDLCFNLTYSPNTVLLIHNGYSDLNTTFLLGAGGKLLSVSLYYFDDISENLTKVVFCDGNCTDIQNTDACGVIRIPTYDPALSPSNRLVAVELALPGTGGGGGGGTGNITIAPPSPETVTLPEPGYISSPSFTTPKGIMTVLLFISFYVFYNQKMTHAQALAVSAVLTGIISILLWGDKYIASIIIIFGVGIALYYVLGK